VRTGRRTRELKKGREMEREKGEYVRWGLRMEKEGVKKGLRTKELQGGRKTAGKGRRAKRRKGIENRQTTQR